VAAAPVKALVVAVVAFDGGGLAVPVGRTEVTTAEELAEEIG